MFLGRGDTYQRVGDIGQDKSINNHIYIFYSLGYCVSIYCSLPI